ncbi:MAG TPA: hypothetical protein PKC76_08925 [Saprospiraceae bacterium]|nr:hypothetical protein [Saprospiraceae bacterium]HMP24241.1 hypothetical protein [Saprospiraceae bacterium]
MKKIFILVLTILFCNKVFSQETTKNGTPQDERFGFSVGYFGDKFRNAGYLFAWENYLATTQNFTVVGTIQFSNFFATQNFTAVSLLPRIGVRYTTNFGLTLESHLGLGYLHRFYSYDEFDVNAAGDLIRKGKASQAAAMPSIALGLGYDFSRKTELPILYFLRASVNYNYPNKHFLFEASYAIETGLTYILKRSRDKRKVRFHR